MHLIWQNHEEEVWDSVILSIHDIRISNIVLRAENEAMAAANQSASFQPLRALPM